MADEKKEQQKPSLTVNLAKEKLEQLILHGGGENILAVTYDPGQASIGGTPFVAVENVTSGFDWDHGKTFLHTSKKLGPSGPELENLRANLRQTTEALAWIQMTLADPRMSDAEKLEVVGGHVKLVQTKKKGPAKKAGKG